MNTSAKLHHLHGTIHATSQYNPLHLSFHPLSLSADSWPDTPLDSAAREAVDWTPPYDLPNMVNKIMFKEIGEIVKNEKQKHKLD